ncbi:OR4KF protein, partial [Chunga burmeisteri]|nr:OR4KF protein [Chunga burmeisteri]
VTELILLGISHTRELQVLFFITIFLANAMVLLQNILTIVVVRADSKLHLPVYFLCCNLSFMDICYTIVTSPRMLMGL